MLHIQFIYGISIVFLVSVCSIASASTEDNKKPVVCTEPRPQLCTQEYSPVCAERFNGIQCITTPCPASEKKQYANACMACADKKVISYISGPCKPFVKQ